MKVLIRNHVYDSEDEAIAVILSEVDKKNISNMSKELNIYCDYPDSMSEKEIKDMLLEFKKGQTFG